MLWEKEGGEEEEGEGEEEEGGGEKEKREGKGECQIRIKQRTKLRKPM